jgi:hypothetical protein
VTVDQDEVWRRGLRARGQHWVMAELHRRAGRPEDVLLEVVFEPPYPTRAFCQQWCAEEANRIRVPATLKAAIVLAALAQVCIGEAVIGWENLAAEQQLEANSAAPGAADAPPSGSAQGVTNDLPGPVSTTPVGTVPAAEPSLNTDLSTICAYQTYTTAACTVQQ